MATVSDSVAGATVRYPGAPKPLPAAHDWSPAAWSWLWARDLLDVIDRLRADLREAPECA